MSTRLQAELVCQALQAAYWRRKPGPRLIMHSDRGSQYASARYRQLIADYRVLQSMSRKADSSRVSLGMQMGCHDHTALLERERMRPA